MIHKTTLQQTRTAPLGMSAARPQPRRGVRFFMQKYGPPMGLVLPFVVLFVLFVLWPVLRSLYLSFTDYTGIKAPNLVGATNYVNMLHDPRFYKALRNSLTYMFFTSLISTSVGLLLALSFGGQKLAHQLMRAAFFLPLVAGGVGIIGVWKWIASSEEFGLFNTVRKMFGAESIRFFGDPHYALPLLIVIGVWSVLGYNMVIFVAGLRSIAPEIYEAAAIDGAGPSARFWKITLPLLRPTILYVLVTGMIGTFQEFFTPYVLFSDTNNVGGILDSGLTLTVYLYDVGFRHFEMGAASAIAWLLFTVIFILTLINLRIGRINDLD
ncbi:sugar ABC transporter permease [Deinococcus sp.]|uniref:carbohydrate ABC transporter permease n=1 Tax=Deinococcus sp. TaxID=47478 RepID=UPI0025D69037|nr:sugar ABC transporter permease [Deinococcus sp.]